MLMEALDSASETPLPATPVFVAAVPGTHSAAEADAQCEAAMREHIGATPWRQPIHPAKKARRCKPHALAELDGATLNDGRFDRSAVVAIDGLVDEKLRAQLLDLIGGTEHKAPLLALVTRSLRRYDGRRGAWQRAGFEAGGARCALRGAAGWRDPSSSEGAAVAHREVLARRQWRS